MELAFQVGQVLVAFGLVLHLLRRRRHRRAAEGAGVG